MPWSVIILSYLLAIVQLTLQVDNGWFSPVFYDFLMEFINIGPVYIRGWAGGARGWWKTLNQRRNKTQRIEFRVAMTCTYTHKGPIFAVHLARSCQSVAARVAAKCSTETKIKVREAFEYTAQSIPNLTNENQVQQCFAALKGSVSISFVVAVMPKLTKYHISTAEASFASWSITKSWVECWTRPYHLKMLCKCLSDMSSKLWSTCPSTTNALRLNLASKAPQAIPMTHAMVDVYHMDKAVVMEYQAAQERIRTAYRDR